MPSPIHQEQEERAEKTPKKGVRQQEAPFRGSQDAAPVRGWGDGLPLETSSSDRHRLLLERLHDPLFSTRRAALLLSLQRAYGNQYVERLLTGPPQNPDSASRADAALGKSLTGSPGSGRPLDRPTRGEMEGRLGTSFPGVRLHTDSAAADAARTLGARAFTAGQDIYFAQGAYRPEAPEGKRLLAHELAHTIQQRGQTPGTQGAVEVVPPDDPLERQADRAADEAMSGRVTPEKTRAALTRSPVKRAHTLLVQRQPAAAPAPPPAPGAAPPGGPTGPAPTGPTETGEFVIGFGGLRIKKEEIDAAKGKGRFEKDLSSMSLPGLKVKTLVLNLEKASGRVSGGHVTADLDIPFVQPVDRGGVKFTIDRDGKTSLDAKAKLAIPALNEPKLQLTLKEGQVAAEATLSAEQLKPPGLPKLKIPEAKVTVGIAGGKLTGSGKVSLEYPDLAKGDFNVGFEEGEPTGAGKVELTPDYLSGTQAQLQIAKGKLEGEVTLPATKLAPPIPGLTISEGTVKLGMSNGQLRGAGEGIAFDYQGLGSGTLSFSISREQLTGGGTLTLSIPGLSEVTGSLSYKAGKLSGKATITPKELPQGLPVKGGAITVLVNERGAISGQGAVRIELFGVGEGALKLGYENGVLDLGAEVELNNIPGLETAKVLIGLKDGKFEGSGEIGIAPAKIPGLTGDLLVEYKDDRFSGKTKIGYAKEKFSGEVEIVLNQDEAGKLAISGSGDVTARLTDWLTGKVHIDVLPDATTKIEGQLKAADIELFPEKKGDKELFNISQNIPLWAILVAVIRIRGGVRAGVGPGMLRGVTAEGQFSTGEGEEPSFSITGELFIPAYAEAYVAFGAGLGLDVVIGSLTGGIEAVGTAGVYGALSAIPEIAYEGGNYSISGEITLAAAAKLKLGLQAWAEVEAFWITVWSQEWKLAEWVWDVGPELALQAKMNYVFGRPEPPTFEFKTSDIDASRLIQDAMPKEGPKGSGAREALQNRADWKGKLQEQRKEASKIPSELAEQQQKAPQPPAPPPKPPKAAPPAELKPKDPAKAKEMQEKELKEKAAPGAEKEMDKARKEKWDKGMGAIEKLRDRSRTDPEDAEEIRKHLAEIKAQYGFTTLTHRPEGDEWIVEAAMSEPRTVRVRGVDPKAPDGTPEKPFPLRWPKRQSAGYPRLYFGGQIGTPRSQADLRAEKGKKDNTGTIIREYDPHKRQALPGGETIGLDAQYRTFPGKVVGPVSDRGTPGGGRINRLLKEYGWSPAAEGMDGDHVVEIQMGGHDVIENLWPLDAGENRGAGSKLSQEKATLPSGETKAMAELKKDKSRQYYFRIDSFGV